MRTMQARIANAQSLAATVNGPAQHIEHMVGYSITAAVTGTAGSAVGTLKIQASNDAFDDNVGAGTYEKSTATWVDIPGSSQAVSDDGTFIWNVDAAFYGACRVVYTRTSGTGTMEVYFTAKGPQS